jgi:hypothetical protein
MQIYFNRRVALLGVLLATQLLSACVVVPRPYYRPRAAAVEPQPGYGGWSHDRRDRDYRDYRGWRGDGEHRDWRDRPDWDGGH